MSEKSMNLKELRAAHPNIKARSRNEFLEKLNNRDKKSGKIKGDGREKKAKKTPPPEIPSPIEIDPPIDPIPVLSKSNVEKQTRSAEGKPIQSYEKGKSGTHPHEGIDVQGKDGDKAHEHELVTKYKQENDNFIAIIDDSEAEWVDIVIGWPKDKYFLLIRYKGKYGPTQTLRAQRGLTKRQFVESCR